MAPPRRIEQRARRLRWTLKQAQHAFAHSPRAARLAEILDQAADRTSDDDVHEAIAILDAAGSIAFARAVAERRLTEAKSALERVPGRPRELVALAGLADYVLRREE